jgi:hypothetical protein
MSEFDKLGSLLHDTTRRQLTPLEIEQIVRQYRGAVLGEMIADAFIWIGRLFSRTSAAVAAARQSKDLTAVAQQRSAAR